MDSKQVAVLVPTTVLAQQHYRVFKERFAPFPVSIAVLSRFQTQAQQKKFLRVLERRNRYCNRHPPALSPDVQFKDLGLLIIDEEHRFGVEAKEKLRKMRENIDTLTMTATPIPRTLNFSLLGVRDISVIETPPPNRLPVYTEIINWNKSIIRDAINKELARNWTSVFCI